MCCVRNISSLTVMNKKQKQEVLLQMNNIFELDAAGEVLGDADVVIFVDGSGLGARYI